MTSGKLYKVWETSTENGLRLTPYGEGLNYDVTCYVPLKTGET